MGPDQRVTQDPAAIDGDEDVEGHGFVNPAPPVDFAKRGPSSGGESLPNDEDGDTPPTD